MRGNQGSQRSGGGGREVSVEGREGVREEKERLGRKGRGS